MKKLTIIILLFFIVLFPQDIFANEYHEFNYDISVSFDPITLIGLFLSIGLNVQNEEDEPIDFRYVWFTAGINWETENQREIGLELLLRGNRVAVITKYRSFYNRERQSGFFGGLYGVAEWRRMFWYFENNSELRIGSSFPFIGHDNVYHSIGIAGGFDIGFRIRINNTGITPFLGLGIPLFLTFGNLPPENYMQEFRVMNIALRAINIGIRLDFFQ